MAVDLQTSLQSSEKSRVQNALAGVIVQVPYGSRLYGTNTPSSDYDYKTLYLPRFYDVMLGRKFTNFKAKFNADGTPNTDPDGTSMPENGYEVEFIALQTFLKDWYDGQTYAVEIAYAILADSDGPGNTLNWGPLNDPLFPALIDEMVQNWQTRNVSGMVGFAMKQTFDYVHRGERLKEAEFFLDLLNQVKAHGCTEVKGNFRLDSVYIQTGELVYDFLMRHISKSEFKDTIKATVTHNVNKDQRSITFAGRQYLETTPLFEVRKVVETRVKSYGTRSTAASETTVDSKSLMHAVRVYQQVKELLTTSNVEFPRPNRDELLGIRNLTTPMEEIVQQLKDLDAEVQELQKLHPPRGTELSLREEYDRWVVGWLKYFYGLQELPDYSYSSLT